MTTVLVQMKQILHEGVSPTFWNYTKNYIKYFAQ